MDVFYQVLFSISSPAQNNSRAHIGAHQAHLDIPQVAGDLQILHWSLQVWFFSWLCFFYQGSGSGQSIGQVSSKSLFGTSKRAINMKIQVNNATCPVLEPKGAMRMNRTNKRGFLYARFRS